MQNEAVAIQPFDALIRRDAYIDLPYPFILGNGVAGTIVALGPDAAAFKVGDRVVSDTSVYRVRETKYGGWQRFVVGNASRTVNVCCLNLLIYLVMVITDASRSRECHSRRLLLFPSRSKLPFRRSMCIWAWSSLDSDPQPHQMRKFSSGELAGL
jgi:NADPH:quinone reductase-like Zn-dependent oxidoreductase